jgi:hypothetical protein
MSLLDWIFLGAFGVALAGIVVWVILKKTKTLLTIFLQVVMLHGIAIGASIFCIEYWF